ncbi:ABC transporter permease [Krasilnikovia cinnamomea]|nr:ABC transporter permease [Krasilnikovia cinnamomea]
MLWRVGSVVERNVLVARRVWLVMLSGLVEPLLYLAGIGFGLGSLIDSVTVGDRTVPYATFVAPAMLAVSAMNGAVYDSTVNVFFKLRHRKAYDTMLVTPLGIGDVAAGEVTWAQLRGVVYSAGFLLVLVVTHTVSWWSALLALPAAAVVGFTFAALGMMVTTFLRSWQDLDLVTLGQVALFLFSTTFFPLSSYPAVLGAVVQVTPLYHAVELIRALCLEQIGWGLLGHLAYLLGVMLVAFAVATRRLGRILVT